MKKVVCDEPHKLSLQDSSKPTPGLGESLVKIHRIGVCGTDLHAFTGTQPFFSYPRVLGHELSGTVEAIHGETHGLKEGDAVVIMPYLECGECQSCLIGKPNCCENMQVIGVHKDGGMSEYITIPTDHLLTAEGLSFDEMALVECQAIGAHAVRRADIQEGEPVLVIGAGPIGLGAAQVAKLKGADVAVMDIAQNRLDFAEKELGIKGVLFNDYENNNPFGGKKAMVVLDATGNKKSMEGALNFLSHGGRLVYIGLFTGSFELVDPEFHKRETTLLASRNATLEDFKTVIDGVRSKKIKMSCMISHETSLDNFVTEMPKWSDARVSMTKAMITVN